MSAWSGRASSRSARYVPALSQTSVVLTLALPQDSMVAYKRRAQSELEKTRQAIKEEADMDPMEALKIFISQGARGAPRPILCSFSLAT